MSGLRKQLAERGLTLTQELDQDGWTGDFLFSSRPAPVAIPWVKTFSKYIGGDQYFNRSYFAVMLVEKGEACYAIAFGKGHFLRSPLL